MGEADSLTNKKESEMKKVAFVLGLLIGFALCSAFPVIGVQFPSWVVAGAFGVVLAAVA